MSYEALNPEDYLRKEKAKNGTNNDHGNHETV